MTAVAFRRATVVDWAVEEDGIPHGHATHETRKFFVFGP